MTIPPAPCAPVPSSPEDREVVDLEWGAQVMSVAIVSLDPNGCVRAWSPGAARIKGYTAADAIGTSFTRFYRPEDRERGLPELLLATARREGSAEDTGWRVRSDGAQFWAHVLITAIRDRDGEVKGFVKIVRDLTEEHRLDEERAGFLRTFAHDLLSPVTALRGYVDLLDDELSEPRALVDRISRVSDHLVAMVAELSAHARGSETGGRRAADVLLIAREAAELVLPGDLYGRIRLHGAGRAILSDDHAALRRAVANVIDNAAKYSEGSIDVLVEDRPESTVIVVTDSGRGIAEDDLPTILEPFQRGRLSDPLDGGTGLGLASVRALLQREGGDIEISSTVGEGTMVTLSLLPASS